MKEVNGPGDEYGDVDGDDKNDFDVEDDND